MTENKTLPCEDCIVFPRCISRTNKRDHVIYVLIHECPMLNKYLEIKESTSYSLTTNDLISEEVFQHRRNMIKEHYGISSGVLDTHYEKYGVEWVR